jgi:nicotinamide-nucleotide adenylyltransferase
VIVALDEGEGTSEEPGLPERWAAMRALLAAQSAAWVTPLVRTPGLVSEADRCAALMARLGPFDRLEFDSPTLRPFLARVSEAAGFSMEFVASGVSGDPCPPPSDTSRALVVLRAQPFHRGHLALIQHAATLADEVVVVVAAAERALSTRDPFTAGERLALVRAGLESLCSRVWLVALPAPSWPAMALAQLAFVAPRYEVVVAHNPLLRGLAAQQGTPVAGLSRPLEVAGQRLSASRVRARLAEQGAGPWLDDYLPPGTAGLLQDSPSLAERCALIAAAEP